MSRGQKIIIILGGFFLLVVLVVLISGGSSTVKRVEEPMEVSEGRETPPNPVEEPDGESNPFARSTADAGQEAPPIIEQPEPTRTTEEATAEPIVAEEISQKAGVAIKAPEPGPSPSGPDDDYVQIGSYRLLMGSEGDISYDRSQYGGHESDICTDAMIDPYTSLAIASCDVDHVVSLAEANESGGWEWGASKKMMFSQDGMNHLATLACVNRSKGARDIAEWSDTWIAKSKACGGGYSVTPEGRCLLATITLKVKYRWGLSVDDSEVEALRTCV